MQSLQGYRLALLISPDTAHRRQLAPLAYRCGLHLMFSTDLRDACALLARERFAVIFCSDQLYGGDVADLLQSLRTAAPETPVIVVSQQAEWPAYLKAMCAGAFDCMAWPLDPMETGRVVRLALAQQPAWRLPSAA
jgi:DNA-binding NtrC family response regulator